MPLLQQRKLFQVLARDIRPAARLVLERVDEQHARPQQLVALQRHVEQVIEDRAFLVEERFATRLPRGKADGQRLLDGGEIARQQFRWRRAERRIRFLASQRQQDGEARNQVVEQRECVPAGGLPA